MIQTCQSGFARLHQSKAHPEMGDAGQGLSKQFPVDKIVINTETHTGQCAERRDLGALGPKWNVFTNLPSRLRDLCGRGGRNSGRARGGG